MNKWFWCYVRFRKVDEILMFIFIRIKIINDLRGLFWLLMLILFGVWSINIKYVIIFELGKWECFCKIIWYVFLGVFDVIIYKVILEKRKMLLFEWLWEGV